jgi:hypothetical protein
MRAGDREPSYCLVGVKRQIDGVEMSLTALVLAILVLVILGFLILGYIRFWEWAGMTGQSISNERQNKRTELDGALLLRSSGGARRRIAPSAFEWAYVSWDNALAGISSTPQRSGGVRSWAWRSNLHAQALRLPRGARDRGVQTSEHFVGEKFVEPGTRGVVESATRDTARKRKGRTPCGRGDS